MASPTAMVPILLLFLAASTSAQFIEPDYFNPDQFGGGGQFGSQDYLDPGGGFFDPLNPSPNLQQSSQQDLAQAASNPFGSNRLCPQLGHIPDFTRINWNTIDRRCEENWWHLYPFGERYFDSDLAMHRLWHDKQIDLDFFLPFMGFRFNYTFIFPEGFVAFSFPRYIQPPYTFPTPQWPHQPDPSLIMAFLSAQSFMFVGDTGISHVWYRIIARPIRQIRERGLPVNVNPQTAFGPNPEGNIYRLPDGRPSYTRFGADVLKIQEGRVEDPNMLDKITRDIRHGMVGARGFIADYALLVTWERMGYGGAPKYTRLDQYNEAKRWQNTYQMVVATDEVRTYVMFNYANINWTSSTAAGALSGRGGRQSAMVGFNGGNGTGAYEMPWSSEGNSYKLVQFGSTQTAGRWQARVDEVVVYGGCSNNSRGKLTPSIPYGTMVGGFALNISGPCYRSSDSVKLQIDEQTIDCYRIDMVKARCPIPINAIYRIGPQDIKVSRDNGREYNFWGGFYLLQHDAGRHQLKLVDDPINSDNTWMGLDAVNLTMKWNKVNITTISNANVDIKLWGYWEDLRTHSLEPIAYLARNVPNNGKYFFNPQMLNINPQDIIYEGAWEKFHFGILSVSANEETLMRDGNIDLGDGTYFSKIVPFGFFFQAEWEYQYGEEWPLEVCKNWYAYDGKMYQYWRELEQSALSCPCTLDQALVDIGRFMPMPECDMFGDGYCMRYPGAGGCFISAYGTWQGAGQTCCYDYDGWLMFGQDYEINGDYISYYGAGVAQRAHIFGQWPYKRPPYLPSFSNYFHERWPWDVCCGYAEHCEFYFWRRETSGCQEYQSGVTGFGYGDAHFITYDGQKYTFNGKGTYVLTQMQTDQHDLMVQVRMEQPPRTDWNTEVRGTVITGVAATDNGSSIVEIYARKDHRRWRYKMDVYCYGRRIFMDLPFKQHHIGPGVTLFSPSPNLNQSQVIAYFATGVGLHVKEQNGVLDVSVILPPHYNESYSQDWLRSRGVLQSTRLGDYDYYGDIEPDPLFMQSRLSVEDSCKAKHRTLGLLGTWNGDLEDDFLTPDCELIGGLNQQDDRYLQSPENSQRIYYEFGQKWKVDGIRYKPLFKAGRAKAIYDPIAYARKDCQENMNVGGFRDRCYVPEFSPFNKPLGNASLAFSFEQVKVQCQNNPSCMFDYLVTGRREIAIDTLRNERVFEAIKGNDGAQYISCGPLQKNEGVIKFPPGNNYLDGITVTFTCQPEYFRHGDESRTCRNGTWSPGWWAWCRSRDLEHGLKWLTGICVTLLFVGMVVAILVWCYFTNVRGRKQRAKHLRSSGGRSGTASKASHGYSTSTVATTDQSYRTKQPAFPAHDEPSGTTIAYYDSEPQSNGHRAVTNGRAPSPQSAGSANFNIPIMESEPRNKRIRETAT